jgi:putative Holliday junction resolvase
VRAGRRLAIDVGSVRVGVAASDLHSILASGLTTIQRSADANITVQEILRHVSDIEPIEIYVGLPIGMSGNHTSSTEDALSLARLLAIETPLPVRLIDERLSTVTAAGALKASGRDAKFGRKVIDQIAATVILEQAMEMERSSGSIPGISLEDFDG